MIEKEILEAQLNQIVIHLCTNAVDAMLQDGGRINVELKNEVLGKQCKSIYRSLHPGRHVRLTISDTGVGMNARQAEQAFDDFYTTKPTGRGLGLGLVVDRLEQEGHRLVQGATLGQQEIPVQLLVAGAVHLQLDDTVAVETG